MMPKPKSAMEAAIPGARLCEDAQLHREDGLIMPQLRLIMPQLRMIMP